MIENLGQGGILGRALADVARMRESSRQRRLARLAFFLAVPTIWFWFRWLTS